MEAAQIYQQHAPARIPSGRKRKKRCSFARFAHRVTKWEDGNVWMRRDLGSKLLRSHSFLFLLVKNQLRKGNQLGPTLV